MPRPKRNVDPIKVGIRIKNIRTSLNLTMAEFASRIDEKAQSGTVNNWEAGRNLPNKVRLEKIAELGKTSSFYLLHGNDNSDTPEYKAIERKARKYSAEEQKELLDYMDNVFKRAANGELEDDDDDDDDEL